MFKSPKTLRVVIKKSSQSFKNEIKLKRFTTVEEVQVCGIGATIRIGQEMLCVPCAGFFITTGEWGFRQKTYFDPFD